jgi:hypothetical protein
MTYRFIKENDGTWFIDLPQYPGPKEDLQMVLGADLLLDDLASGNLKHRVDGKVELWLELSSMYITDGDVLIKDDKMNFVPKELKQYVEELGGAFYHKSQKSIWLCNVTEFVFGKFPSQIWFKVC